MLLKIKNQMDTLQREPSPLVSGRMDGRVVRCGVAIMVEHHACGDGDLRFGDWRQSGRRSDDTHDGRDRELRSTYLTSTSTLRAYLLMPHRKTKND